MMDSIAITIMKFLYLCIEYSEIIYDISLYLQEYEIITLLKET